MGNELEFVLAWISLSAVASIPAGITEAVRSCHGLKVREVAMISIPCTMMWFGLFLLFMAPVVGMSYLIGLILE